MLSKQANQFILELKMYLMSKGKNEQEIEGVIDELTDHLIQAEAAGKSIKDITGNSPREYMKSIGKEMGFDIKQFLILTPMTALLIIAYTCFQPAIQGEITLSKMGVLGAAIGGILSLILFGFLLVRVLPKMFYSKWFYVIVGIAYVLLTCFFIVIHFFDKNPFFVATPLQNNLILVGCLAIFIIWSVYSKTWITIIIALILSIEPIAELYIPKNINEDPLYIKLSIVFSILCIIVLFYFFFKNGKSKSAS